MEKLFEKDKVACRGALTAMIVVCIIGILTYLYRAFAGIGITSIMSYFPYIMCLLMYVSVFRYIIDYFKKGIEASIQGMMMRFCALTAAGVIMSGGDVAFGLLTCDLVILLLVPIMRDGLQNVKTCTGVSIIVGIVSIVSAYFKLTAAAPQLAASSDILFILSTVFDCINMTLLWLMFAALYFIRIKQIKLEIAKGILPNPYEAGNMEKFKEEYAKLHVTPEPKEKKSVKEKVAERKAKRAEDASTKAEDASNSDLETQASESSE